MDKDTFITQYKKLKELHNGQKPLYSEFLKFSGVHKRKLDEAFGKNAYSKLQQECGDDPNKILMERTPLMKILGQYGHLVRELSEIPVAADWIHAKFRPTPDGLNRVHNLKWRDMPTIFLKELGEQPEWKDVIGILKQRSSVSSIEKTNRTFTEIVEKIQAWTPDRKRLIEEGYKIELRGYLEKHFNLEEEVGESNPDLLLNKKFPIEIKKDPSQSEYDRLLGQMIRHNTLYGSAIAIVTSISSTDRFKKFQRLFTDVHGKLGMTAELILK